MPDLRCGYHILAAQHVLCRPHGLGEIESQLALDHDAHNGRGMAPQGKGIFRAARDQTDEEKSSDAVQAVRQRQHFSRERLRQLPFHGARHVLLTDCRAHHRRFAVMFGIFPAHQALQGRKLPDDAGQEIGLAEFRRAPAILNQSVVAELPGHMGRHRDDTLRFLMQAAEFLVERHRQLFRHAIDQRGLAIFIEEELGIGQPRRQNPLVPFANQLHVRQLHVGDGEEIRQQRALLIDQREIPLMLLHGGHEDFFREREIMRLEGTQNRQRRLHHIDGLLQQIVVLVQMAAGRLGERGQLVEDHRAPPLLIHNHPMPFGLLHIVRNRLHRKALRAGHLGAQHPMSVTQIAGLDRGELDREYLPAAQGHQPAHRPGEAYAGLVPMHGFGKRQFAKELRQGLGQNRRHGLSLFLLHRKEILALGRLPHL